MDEGVEDVKAETDWHPLEKTEYHWKGTRLHGFAEEIVDADTRNSRAH